MAVIECQHCGQKVETDEPSKVRTGHTASSGMPRQWVMYEGGEELHRCQLVDVGLDDWQPRSATQARAPR
jgi:hypothetical protein